MLAMEPALPNSRATRAELDAKDAVANADTARGFRLISQGTKTLRCATQAQSVGETGRSRAGVASFDGEL